MRRPATADASTVVAAADDDADDDAERGPLRRCAVTRARQPREVMIRFVVSPERVVLPDLAATLPGRGIWLSARADVIQGARTKGAFARAARGAVTVPPDLLPGLVATLERRIGDHIGLARRAGQAVCGFDRAREWLETGRAALVIQAVDGSADERARFLGRHIGQVAVALPLAGERLGALFGRERAVHVAVAPGRLAERLRADATRLAGVRGDQDGGPEASAPVRRGEGDRGRATGRDQTDQ